MLFTLLGGCVLAEDVVVTVFSAPEAVVRDASGNELGRTGQALRMSLPEGTTTLVISHDGYHSESITLTADKLRQTNRIPEQGVLELKREGSALPLALAGVLMVGLAVAVKLKRPSSTANQFASDVFQKGELLGEGATAYVYGATSEIAPGQSLAVKILKPECIGDEAVKGRLKRSIESGVELEHPNLVKVHAWGTTRDGSPFLLLERLHGVTLEHYLQKTPRPAIEDILDIMESLCSVVGYLHSKTIVHRDVKPENIFLTRESKVKLMDLEISRSRDSEDLTKTGVVVGTPFYLAPEQIRGELSPQSDQYSLGVILFQMLTGQKPFQADNSMDLINQHLFEPVPSLRALNPSLTPLQEAVVNKMLAKQPEQRFPDLSQAWDAMKEAFLNDPDDDATVL